VVLRRLIGFIAGVYFATALISLWAAITIRQLCTLIYPVRTIDRQGERWSVTGVLGTRERVLQSPTAQT
jgi:hypothetical protein